MITRSLVIVGSLVTLAVACYFAGGRELIQVLQ